MSFQPIQPPLGPAPSSLQPPLPPLPPVHLLPLQQGQNLQMQTQTPFHTLPTALQPMTASAATTPRPPCPPLLHRRTHLAQAPLDPRQWSQNHHATTTLRTNTTSSTPDPTAPDSFSNFMWNFDPLFIDAAHTNSHQHHAAMHQHAPKQPSHLQQDRVPQTHQQTPRLLPGFRHDQTISPAGLNPPHSISHQSPDLFLSPETASHTPLISPIFGNAATKQAPNGSAMQQAQFFSPLTSPIFRDDPGKQVAGIIQPAIPGPIVSHATPLHPSAGGGNASVGSWQVANMTPPTSTGLTGQADLEMFQNSNSTNVSPLYMASASLPLPPSTTQWTTASSTPLPTSQPGLSSVMTLQSRATSETLFPDTSKISAPSGIQPPADSQQHQLRLPAVRPIPAPITPAALMNMKRVAHNTGKYNFTKSAGTTLPAGTKSNGSTGPSVTTSDDPSDEVSQFPIPPKPRRSKRKVPGACDGRSRRKLPGRQAEVTARQLPPPPVPSLLPSPPSPPPPLSESSVANKEDHWRDKESRRSASTMSGEARSTPSISGASPVLDPSAPCRQASRSPSLQPKLSAKPDRIPVSLKPLLPTTTSVFGAVASNPSNTRSFSSTSSGGNVSVTEAATNKDAAQRLQDAATFKLATRSNYQNLLSGESQGLGLHYKNPPQLGLAEKRTIHKESEKKRRDLMKRTLEDLREVVPGLPPLQKQGGEEDGEADEGRDVEGEHGQCQQSNRKGGTGASKKRKNQQDHQQPVSKTVLLQRVYEYIGFLQTRDQYQTALLRHHHDSSLSYSAVPGPPVSFLSLLGEGEQLYHLDADELFLRLVNARERRAKEKNKSDEQQESQQQQWKQQRNHNTVSSDSVQVPVKAKEGEDGEEDLR